MTFTTKAEIDEINISLNGIISIRQNISVLNGENVIGNTFQRTTLIPGQDISDQPANVIAICNVTWTPDVITSYQASLPQTIPTGV
jgi:hypothetical protein